MLLTVEEWETICEWQWRTTASLTWREFCWKNLVRFFITPLQKRHQVQGSRCWRMCGGENVNHFHIFWDCPSLTQYWQEIHEAMELVFGMPIPFRCEVMYLGHETLVMSSTDASLFRILMAACKKTFTKKWLRPQIPTLNDWVDIVHEIFIMERLTYSLRLKKDKFEKIWAKWIVYITPIRQDFV